MFGSSKCGVYGYITCPHVPYIVHSHHSARWFMYNRWNPVIARQNVTDKESRRNEIREASTISGGATWTRLPIRQFSCSDDKLVAWKHRDIATIQAIKFCVWDRSQFTQHQRSIAFPNTNHITISASKSKTSSLNTLHRINCWSFTILDSAVTITVSTSISRQSLCRYWVSFHSHG